MKSTVANTCVSLTVVKRPAVLCMRTFSRLANERRPLIVGSHLALVVDCWKPPYLGCTLPCRKFLGPSLFSHPYQTCNATTESHIHEHNDHMSDVAPSPRSHHSSGTQPTRLFGSTQLARLTLSHSGSHEPRSLDRAPKGDRPIPSTAT